MGEALAGLSPADHYRLRDAVDAGLRAASSQPDGSRAAARADAGRGGERLGAAVRYGPRPMFYDDDADLSLLDGKTVAIIGFGSQGHAHALNLKDSGVDVVVGLREDSSSVAAGARRRPRGAARRRRRQPRRHRDDARARRAAPPGLGGRGPRRHRRGQPAALRPRLLRALRRGRAARRASTSRSSRPKGPGHLVRRQYTEGSGVPGLDRHPRRTRPATPQALALAYAKGIGCTRGGVIETTFKDETETDLFGEQAVLCGGASELVQAGFETLVEAGYDPQMAYFECLHELKLIVDLMYEKGLAGMRYSISNTAEYGDYTRGKRVITDETRAEMKRILERDPVRRLRPRVDRREPRRPGELQAHARRAGRHPGRDDRQGAALDDGLDQDRLLRARRAAVGRHRWRCTARSWSRSSRRARRRRRATDRRLAGRPSAGDAGATVRVGTSRRCSAPDGAASAAAPRRAHRERRPPCGRARRVRGSARIRARRRDAGAAARRRGVEAAAHVAAAARAATRSASRRPCGRAAPTASLPQRVSGGTPVGARRAGRAPVGDVERSASTACRSRSTVAAATVRRAAAAPTSRDVAPACASRPDARRRRRRRRRGGHAARRRDRLAGRRRLGGRSARGRPRLSVAPRWHAGELDGAARGEPRHLRCGGPDASRCGPLSGGRPRSRRRLR